VNNQALMNMQLILRMMEDLAHLIEETEPYFESERVEYFLQSTLKMLRDQAPTVVESIKDWKRVRYETSNSSVVVKASETEEADKLKVEIKIKE
jgi:hypothetical protein